MAPAIVVADAGYGIDTALRDQLSARDLQYVLDVTKAVELWPQGAAPLPPPPWSGHGRKPKLVRRDPQHEPVAVKALALAPRKMEKGHLAGRH